MLTLLLYDTRSSAGEKQHTRGSPWRPGKLNANSALTINSLPQFRCLWKQDGSTRSLCKGKAELLIEKVESQP